MVKTFFSSWYSVQLLALPHNLDFCWTPRTLNVKSPFKGVAQWTQPACNLLNTHLLNCRFYFLSEPEILIRAHSPPNMHVTHRPTMAVLIHERQGGDAFRWSLKSFLVCRQRFYGHKFGKVIKWFLKLGLMSVCYGTNCFLLSISVACIYLCKQGKGMQRFFFQATYLVGGLWIENW